MKNSIAIAFALTSFGFYSHLAKAQDSNPDAAISIANDSAPLLIFHNELAQKLGDTASSCTMRILQDGTEILNKVWNGGSDKYTDFPPAVVTIKPGLLEVTTACAHSTYSGDFHAGTYNNPEHNWDAALFGSPGVLDLSGGRLVTRKVLVEKKTMAPAPPNLGAPCSVYFLNDSFGTRAENEIVKTLESKNYTVTREQENTVAPNSRYVMTAFTHFSNFEDNSPDQFNFVFSRVGSRDAIAHYSGTPPRWPSGDGKRLRDIESALTQIPVCADEN